MKDATIAPCSTSESQKRQASGLRTLCSASLHYFLSGGCCASTFFDPEGLSGMQYPQDRALSLIEELWLAAESETSNPGT
jgi:hypothetical protein